MVTGWDQSPEILNSCPNHVQAMEISAVANSGGSASNISKKVLSSGSGKTKDKDSWVGDKMGMGRIR